VLFAYGFRPFFLLAGLMGALALLAWLGIWWGVLDMEGTWTGARWHAHEMIYGFALAGVAGFLLTAVPNWTGTPAVAGRPLAGLAGLWLLGRVLMAASAVTPPPTLAIVDLAFLPALGVVVGRPLVARALAAKSPRNLVFLLLFAALWTGDLLTHLDALEAATDTAATGLVLGRDTLLLMIGVMGGRIIPAFTRNALRLQGDETPIRSERWTEWLAQGGLAALLMADLVLGDGVVVGAVALAAALANLRRLILWQPLRTRAQPILWILHLGYAWLVAGLALTALAELTDWVPGMAAMHALTAGAIGTMLLGVMSRVALGHTGRPLVVSGATVAAYALLFAAASTRVAAPFLPTLYLPLVLASGLLWSAAFALFTAAYLPILTRPRPDGRPG
jgi:uncharacterized protein involved in response to NO